ncbi:hypothetical protein RS130_09660 [Paraglaciecola aquimarina]|uniref:Uncharacterized protein n=1 Tax=Paraglaciecola aquimarina TaxID=1235557 RepID=A0ABU3SVW9_9ALTE|nr:hypothetical protein [Paraglaciecola aquimarina]MDU0354165.1 hypothetical protein [Paraglaciecola aquimarina]
MSFAIGAMGELSTIDVFPEVWLYDNEWSPKAMALVKAFEAQPLVDTPHIAPNAKNKMTPILKSAGNAPPIGLNNDC